MAIKGKVAIYEDVLTHQKLEGFAKIIEHLGYMGEYRGQKIQRYKVVFITDKPSREMPVERDVLE